MFAYNPENFSDEFNNYLVKYLRKAEFKPIEVESFAKKYNLTQFFSNFDAQKTYGFIGYEMERFRFYVYEVEQDKSNSKNYNFKAKSKVENNLSNIVGSMILKEIYEFPEPITRHGLALCRFEVSMKEDGEGTHIGKFVGDYYLVLSKVVHDIRFPKAIPQFIQNHTFVGYWESNSKELKMPVLFGVDYLLEDLEDILYGITKLMPIESEVIEQKWKSYFDAFSEDTPEELKNQAISIESEQWWK